MTLCDLFGLPSSGHKSSVTSVYFYDSAAWKGLIQWLEKHPTLARQYSTCDTYLPGWYELAHIALVRRAEQRAKYPKRFHPRPNRRKYIENITAPQKFSSASQPTEAADRLIRRCQGLIGMPQSTVEAQDIVAKVHFYPDWQSLLSSLDKQNVSNDGVSSLTDPAAAKRRAAQVSILADHTNLSHRTAKLLLQAAYPSTEGGDAHDFESEEAWPSISQIGLLLTREDEAMLSSALIYVRAFQSAAEEVLVQSDAPEYEVSARQSGAITANHRRFQSQPVRKSPMSSCCDGLELAQEMAEKAVVLLFNFIQSLAPLPFLTPIDDIKLSLPHPKLRCPDQTPNDPDLALSLEIVLRSPNNDWPSTIGGAAVRAVTVFLGLRRSFLSAGWQGGDIYLIGAQEGVLSRYLWPVLAGSPGEAVLWLYAGRSALRMLDQTTRWNKFRIHSVEGVNGTEDIVRSFEYAKRTSPLYFPWSKSAEVGHIPLKILRYDHSWYVDQSSSSRTVVVHDRKTLPGKEIKVLMDDPW